MPALSAALLAWAPLACEDETIREYEVAKDPTAGREPDAQRRGGSGAASPTDAGAMGSVPVSGVASPGRVLSWEAPEGWRESAEARPMRVATFFAGDEASPLEVAVTAFPGDVGGVLANVNRWRGQLGLPAVQADELSGMLEPIEGDGVSGFVVQMQQSEAGASGQVQGMLAASLEPASRDETWFVKAMDTPAKLAAHRQEFLAFVRSFRTVEAGRESPPPDAAAPMPESNGLPGPVLNGGETERER